MEGKKMDKERLEGLWNYCNNIRSIMEKVQNNKPINVNDRRAIINFYMEVAYQVNHLRKE